MPGQIRNSGKRADRSSRWQERWWDLDPAER
jgi:hypothetical protein